MTIPAQAFAEIDPSELVAGQLFLFRGFWSLRASVGDALEGFLVLEGAHTGSMFQMAHGMAKVVAVVSPFIWYPMLPDLVKPAAADDSICTLALTSDGPVIVCLDARDKWNQTYFGIATNGEGKETIEVRRSPHFAKWSVELCHQDRPYRSLGTLVKIDRRQKA